MDIFRTLGLRSPSVTVMLKNVDFSGEDEYSNPRPRRGCHGCHGHTHNIILYIIDPSSLGLIVSSCHIISTISTYNNSNPISQLLGAIVNRFIYISIRKGTGVFTGGSLINRLN